MRAGVALRVDEGPRQPGSGIGVRTKAQHDVEQDRRGLRIGALRAHGGVAQRRVDHRVRAPAGVVVVAEVEEHVAVHGTVHVPGEWQRAFDRGVRAARQAACKERQLGLVAEGAAGEQRAHRLLGRCHRRGTVFHRRDRGLGERCRWPGRCLAIGECHRHIGGMAQRRRGNHAGGQGLRRGAEEMHHDGLAGGARGRLDLAGDLR